MNASQPGEKRGLFPFLLAGLTGPLAQVLGLAAVVLLLSVALVGRPLLAGRVYDGGDITRLYLPQRAELARALHEGRLPWWSSRMGLGYPLVAGGEVGALYPPNWLIYSVMPAAVGLTVSIVLHYAWAALGFALYLRHCGRTWPASLLGAMVMAFGGFVGAHLTHISMLTVASWLPWMLLATGRLFTSARPWRAATGLAASVALQFCGGHPQVSLLGMLALGLLALWMALLRRPRAWARLGLWAGAMVVGALLALPQLGPAAVLAAQSQRAGGLDDAFFMSYSFHPLLTATYVSPFLLGVPDPEGSVELMAYVGLLPLALAWVAVWRSRERSRWLYLGLALAGWVLALGRWNPLYGYLLRIPVLNLFRVPARYLYWTGLGLGYLSALGMDALRWRQPATEGWRQKAGWCALLLAVGGVAAVAVARGLDGAVAAWRWLPLIWAAALLLVMAAIPGLGWRKWAPLALAVLVCDLMAFGLVLDRSYHTSAPPEQLIRAPRVTAVLSSAEQSEPQLTRVWVKEDILPALSVMQGSLFPNVAATHGLAAANLYSPLVPRAYLEWAQGLDSAGLSRMGISHYLIPQLLPVDAERELYDVYNPYAALPYEQWLEVEPVDIVAVEVESYLSHAADMTDGSLAAELFVRTSEGQVHSLPVRAGTESAEWAYERDDVRAVSRHQMPPVAHSWPARSGYLPWEHVGHTYRATYSLEATVGAVEILPVLEQAFVRIEEVQLIGRDGAQISLRAAIGQGQHSIIYRDEDVLAYENQDAWPRAYAVPWARVTHAGRDASLEPFERQELLPVKVAAYGDMEIVLRTQADVETLVVLSDLDYPGWGVRIDGVDASALRVDGVARGVRVPAGSHEIVWHYHPLKLTLR